MSTADSSRDGVRLVVGLGNPGSTYDGTRHNIGFAFADRLVRGGWKEKGKGLVGEGVVGADPVVLLKPQTFMNLSGDAVLPLVQFHKLEPAMVVVVHDDIDLPLGIVRLKQGGGDGGHNGLKSISQRIGSDYVRLRLGVGRPAVNPAEGPREVADWVLARFDRAEAAVVEDELKRAADALELLQKEGLKAAQNRFNR